MTLSNRESQLLAEIQVWEQHLGEDLRSDFGRTYDKWLNRKLNGIPEPIKRKFFDKFDDILFHLHSFIQNSHVQHDARQQLLMTAKTFDEDIHHIYDLKKLSVDQLHYISDLQLSKHRLYSFVQGGLAGTGGFLLMGIDLPAQMLLNLRAVQMTALSYGYEVNSPFEMMTSLKVYHAALLPKHLRYKQWVALTEDLNNKDENPFFYEGEDKLANQASIDHLIKQLVKVSAISMLRKKMIGGIPLIGMAIGAGINYQLTRQITDFAHQYYRYRLLLEKKDADYEFN
jgi:hypothetical protein